MRESAAALLACGLGKTARGDWLCATCEYQNSQYDVKCRNPQCPTTAGDYSYKDLPQDLMGLFEPRGKGTLGCKSCDLVYRANDIWGMRAHWYFSQGRNRFYCRRSGELFVKTDKDFVREAARSTMMHRSETVGDLAAGRCPAKQPSTHARRQLGSERPKERRISVLAQAVLDAAKRTMSDASSEDGDETRFAIGSRDRLKRPLEGDPMSQTAPPSMSSRSRSGRGSPGSRQRSPSSRQRKLERKESNRATGLGAKDAKQHGLKRLEQADPEALKTLDRAIRMFQDVL